MEKKTFKKVVLAYSGGLEGMLLCAEDENGELALMVPEKKMPSGAEIC